MRLNPTAIKGQGDQSAGQPSGVTTYHTLPTAIRSAITCSVSPEDATDLLDGEDDSHDAAPSVSLRAVVCKILLAPSNDDIAGSVCKDRGMLVGHEVQED